jgi:transposase
MIQLKEKVSQYLRYFQEDLFPWLEENLGPLSEKQQQLITVLEIARVEEFIQSYRGWVGRPQDDRIAIARAFVAKAVYNIPTTRQLIDRLRSDKKLRQICGWQKVNDVSEEWTFSRAFVEFSNSQLGERVHETLIKNYESERLIGHISRDSTAIEAREKMVKNENPPEPIAKAKRGRPKKGEVRPPPALTQLERQLTQSLEEMRAELSKTCDVGTKVNSKGYKESWKGYKLHIDTADGGIPISAILTSASVHDSQVAIPLATLTDQRVVSLYDLMDAGYDAQVIRSHSESLGHVPLIDFNRRRSSEIRFFLPHEAERYKIRSTAERVNSRIKDEFGAAKIYVRGHAKILTHLMFGLIALTVDQLMRLIT